MVFHWSLSGSKSPQVSGILLSILADLNNAVVWMVSTSLISKFSCPFINPLVTVPRGPITIGINVTFMSHNFFNSLEKSREIFFFSLPFNFILWSVGVAKFRILQVLFIIIIIIIIIYSLRVFHISFSWWSFTGVWVRACLLKCPGLFLVFWLFSM